MATATSVFAINTNSANPNSANPNSQNNLALTEIKQTPNRDEVMAEVGEITSDEKEINIVDSFLKKIYYLYDK